MSNLLLRLKQMLLGWGTVGVIYNFSDYLQGEGYQLTPSVIDNLIAFSPSAVWLYLSFFHCAVRLFIHTTLSPALAYLRNATFGTGSRPVLSSLAHNNAISLVWSVGDICGRTKRADSD